MEYFTYHSPEGDREMPLISRNSDGTVNIGFPSDGDIINRCKIVNRFGGCSPKEVSLEEFLDDESNQENAGDEADTNAKGKTKSKK